MRGAYATISLHPARSHDGRDAITYSEAWGCWKETTKDGKEWDGEGIIGFLYAFSNGYVWLNEGGHPSHLFTAREDLVAWLQGKTECLTWSEEPRT